jgi:phosphotransferase system  glucose/maltose/N-acetylglucosamine-specific IIC component
LLSLVVENCGLALISISPVNSFNDATPSVEPPFGIMILPSAPIDGCVGDEGDTALTKELGVNVLSSMSSIIASNVGYRVGIVFNQLSNTRPLPPFLKAFISAVCLRFVGVGIVIVVLVSVVVVSADVNILLSQLISPINQLSLHL